MAAAPDATRALTRWALATSVGDVAAPLVVGGLAWLGLGWRTATGVAAAATAAALVGAWGPRLDDAPGDGADREADPGPPGYPAAVAVLGLEPVVVAAVALMPPPAPAGRRRRGGS